MNIIPIHLPFPYKYFTNYENLEKCSGVGEYEKNNKGRKNVKEFLTKLTEKYGKNLVKFFPDKNENKLTGYDFTLQLFDNIIIFIWMVLTNFKITTTLEITSDEIIKRL